MNSLMMFQDRMHGIHMRHEIQCDILPKCLRLVVLQDKDVIKKLRVYEARIGVKLYTTPLIFRVPRMCMFPNIFYSPFDSFEEEPSCDCWFEHEYLDYMQNGHCNDDMFTRICSNLENGQCEHLKDEESAMAKIYLIHAADATDNKKVTKYISRQIMKRSYECLNDLTTGVGSLTAAHVAVLKGSGEAVQYVIGLYAAKKESYIYRRTFFGMFHSFSVNHRNVSIAKRNDITGHVETIELKGRDVLTYLLANCKSPSQIKILFQFLPSMDQKGFEDLMSEYLLSKDEESARIVLEYRRSLNMCLDSTILLNATFLHAHDFVYSWIKQKLRLSVEVMGVTIHALLIAEALGCQKCIALIQRGMQKHHATQNELKTCEDSGLSLFPFIVIYIADKFKYGTDILIDIFKTICSTGICDLNKRNSSFETVLHVLIKSTHCTNEALACLLEFGCDVNASDNKGRTALHILLESSTYSVDTVKCLLEHGADVNKTDFKGETPFLKLLKEGRFSFGNISLHNFHQLDDRPLECLKYILYFNPRVDIHSDVLNTAESIECFGHFKGYINLPLVPSDKSVSLFAILMEMGFIKYRPDEFFEDYFIYRLFGRPMCNGYYTQFISQPRSLQSICRVGIRQAFPGYQLHKLFRLINIPRRLREYVLFENILFYKETLSRS